MPPFSDQFHTTRWTRVAAAKGDSEAGKIALSELCEIYYQPVERFLLHTAARGNSDEARELTHAFFATVLEQRGSGIAGAEAERGKFRSYLLGAVKHFLSDRRKAASALKRVPGNGASGARNENRVPGNRSPLPENDEVSAPDEAVFDREWALAVLGRALEAVSRDSRRFEVLKPWLTGEAGGVSQAEAAAELGMTEAAVKVAIHRLRKRLRKALESEIAETVDSPEEIRAELRYLASALAS